MFNFPLVLRSGDFTRYCAWKNVNREIPLGVLVNLAKTMHGNALPRRYLMNSKTRWASTPMTKPIPTTAREERGTKDKPRYLF
jgi:hypothetical protein